jgi:predicted alpha/beta hydrolase family esterase
MHSELRSLGHRISYRRVEFEDLASCRIKRWMMACAELVRAGQAAILLAGSLSVAVLAIITEVGFGALERGMTPKGLKIAQKRAR